MRNRGRWLGVTAAAAVAVAVAGGWLARHTRHGARRPSVVLIVVDTLRADHLGCYGYPRATSPALDALAASGVRFANVRATSSWTAASVASLFTGLYPAVHGLQANDALLAEGLTTLAERFAANGYATAGFSANAAFVIPEQGFAQGFDEFHVLHGPPLPADSGEDKIPLDPSWKNFAKVATADVVTDAALAWLGSRSARDPYFLYLHYFDPHAGYFPPPQYRARMGVPADASLAGPAQWDFWIGFKLGAGHDQLPTLAALYDGEIAFTDAEIGRLLATLRQRGDAAPIVVVTSDHGEEFAEHGDLQHGSSLFEEQIRVPLIVAGPAVPTGAVVAAPVSLVGMAATLADLTGTSTADATPPPAPSFAALVRGADGPAPTGPIFADLATSSARHRDMIVDGRWKLVRAGDASHLFDLAADPGEIRDLAGADAADAQRLAAALDAREQAAAVVRVAPGTVPSSELRRARLKALGYAE